MIPNTGHQVNANYQRLLGVRLSPGRYTLSLRLLSMPTANALQNVVAAAVDNVNGVSLRPHPPFRFPVFVVLIFHFLLSCSFGGPCYDWRVFVSLFHSRLRVLVFLLWVGGSGLHNSASAVKSTSVMCVDFNFRMRVDSPVTESQRAPELRCMEQAEGSEVGAMPVSSAGLRFVHGFGVSLLCFLSSC